MSQNFADEFGFLNLTKEITDYSVLDPGSWVPLLNMSQQYPPPHGHHLPLRDTRRTTTTSTSDATEFNRNHSTYSVYLKEVIPPLTLRVSTYTSRLDPARVPLPPTQSAVQAAAMHEIQTLAKQRSDEMVPQVPTLFHATSTP